MRAQAGQAQPPEPAPQSNEKIEKAHGWGRVKQQVGIRLESFLLKQNSENSFNPGKWQKRKFILKNGKLSYLDANNELIKASYSVTDIKNMRLIKKGENVLIEISMEERLMRISSAIKDPKQAEKEMHRWGSAIRQAINFEVGQDTEPQEAKQAVRKGLYSPASDLEPHDATLAPTAVSGGASVDRDLPRQVREQVEQSQRENATQEAELAAYLEAATKDSPASDESGKAGWRRVAQKQRQQALSAHKQAFEGQQGKTGGH